MRVYVHVLVLAALAATPFAADGQPLARIGSPVGDADLLYFAGRPQEAYEILSARLEIAPKDYDALWRAARCAVVLGIDADGIYPQNAWLDPAIELGDRAVAERPDGIEGLYWRGAAEGRRALNAGPGYAAELAQRVYDDAHAILAVDSLHGGAHNLLGKLNYEVMSLSRVERFIGKVLVRKPAIRNSSWQAAEYHLKAAVDAWPELVLFEFDLAQLYKKRGRKDEARAAFRRVIEMPAVHPPDGRLKKEAEALLEELGS